MHRVQVERPFLSSNIITTHTKYGLARCRFAPKVLCMRGALMRPFSVGTHLWNDRKQSISSVRDECFVQTDHCSDCTTYPIRTRGTMNLLLQLDLRLTIMAPYDAGPVDARHHNELPFSRFLPRSMASSTLYVRRARETTKYYNARRS